MQPSAPSRHASAQPGLTATIGWVRPPCGSRAAPAACPCRCCAAPPGWRASSTGCPPPPAPPGRSCCSACCAAGVTARYSRTVASTSRSLRSACWGPGAGQSRRGTEQGAFWEPAGMQGGAGWAGPTHAWQCPGHCSLPLRGETARALAPAPAGQGLVQGLESANSHELVGLTSTHTRQCGTPTEAATSESRLSRDLRTGVVGCGCVGCTEATARRSGPGCGPDEHRGGRRAGCLLLMWLVAALRQLGAPAGQPHPQQATKDNGALASNARSRSNRVAWG